MWWSQPLLREFNPLLSPNLLDLVARAYALVEVGGLTGCGAQRGRNFEQLFYKLCRSRGIHLLPLLYEAVARGAAECLSPAECDVVRDRVFWACRSLQCIVKELYKWTTVPHGSVKCGPGVIRIVKEILDVQEQIGTSVADYLDEHFPDWIDDAAEEAWHAVGGW